ncbi:GNAT family N-acetyltransferase [Tepidibacter thalassicus]|uniref:Protein N-acetyltransferase, RimJ/RimL family n=1 Tax=Tepidibacter thalassicus DSM 15285 TaxID=1123350 RepID=A0A1M5R3S4_9FIRM|nr:GNAT family N-acetyltransferase [Tepidibacter thalassicus]SHH20808.1 Protein N-acetyltransferase, RimJ/RimL family [Tepidibacter thalassicus DSM 15285]
MDIQLRLANYKDCDLLFNWANDDLVRKNSFNSSKIDYSEHRKWFRSKIESNNSKIYICILNNKNIGQVRIDIEEHTGMINYSIDKDYRGLGIGTEILKLIKSQFSNLILIGRVKYGNIPSIKAFEKAGYIKFEKENYIEFIANLGDEYE